ncbi:MAG TPA: DUF1080 domain-containing protein [Phycisphaerae bacterium]|nr:DUF1080 domain-containing protein [Phycisphaerae bacterium]
MMSNHLIRIACVLMLAGLVSCSGPEPGKPAEPATKPATKPAATQPVAAAAANAPKPPEGKGWIALFDGKSLDGWKVPKFGGDGKVYVKDGAIHIERGDMCSGFTYDDANGPMPKLPKEDYELVVDAMRVEGDDFFCGLTFPVGKDYISLIPDGWAGSVTGLSCLDDFDASMNETTQDLEFKNQQWYRFRCRVTRTHITCWVDDKQIIHVARGDRKIGIRGEVEQSCPLGVATWMTHAAVRGIWVRVLPLEET